MACLWHTHRYIYILTDLLRYPTSSYLQYPVFSNASCIVYGICDVDLWTFPPLTFVYRLAPLFLPKSKKPWTSLKEQPSHAPISFILTIYFSWILRICLGWVGSQNLLSCLDGFRISSFAVVWDLVKYYSLHFDALSLMFGIGNSILLSGGAQVTDLHHVFKNRPTRLV